MKKRLLILSVTVVILTTISYAQVSFGIRAGVNFQNINGKSWDGKKMENQMIVGYNAGANVEIPIAHDFFLQPALLFSTKGAKLSEGDEEGRMNINYLELPIHLLFKPQLGNGKLILGIGPYLSYGIMGNMKPIGGEEMDIKFKNTLTAEDQSDEYYYLKGLDAGADLFFGYEFDFKLSVQFNAQLGLLNMWPSYEGWEDDETVLKNTGFGISFGYRF